MKRYRRRLRQHQRGAAIPNRNERGAGLVEALVALVICSIFLCALGQDMSQLSIMGIRGEQQFLAADVAQEVIDSCRNLRWSDAQNANGIADYTPGVYNLQSNTGTGTAPAVLPRPLLLDQTTFTYDNHSVSNKFRPTATLTLAWMGNNNDQIFVTCDIVWTVTGGKTKSYTATTIISKYGVHQE
jgi:hypothetical protein